MTGSEIVDEISSFVGLYKLRRRGGNGRVFLFRILEAERCCVFDRSFSFPFLRVIRVSRESPPICLTLRILSLVSVVVFLFLSLMAIVDRPAFEARATHTGPDGPYGYVPTEWICILFVVLFSVTSGRL